MAEITREKDAMKDVLIWTGDITKYTVPPPNTGGRVDRDMSRVIWAGVWLRVRLAVLIDAEDKLHYLELRYL